MCGLVGVAGKIFMKEEKVLKNLLVFDTVRGEDSTGIAAIPVQGNAIIAKEVGDPFNLFQMVKFEQAFKKINRAIIGHNRWATVGGISKQTAHPFELDTIIGTHNGTLKNKYRLADHQDFKVDSENLFWHIQEHGLADALKIIDGAWALVWWDKVEETLNFLRNKERPLFVVETEDGATIFWASEKWMLSVACSRHDLKIKEIHEIATDMHYSFHIGADKKIEKVKIKPAAGTYEPPIFQNGNWNNQIVPTQNAANSNNVTPIKEAGKGTPEKKLLKLPKPTEAVGAGLVKSYLHSKRVLFEIAGSCIDSHGARYLKLLDVMTPAAPVRLYVKKGDPLQHMIGKEIIADIDSFVSDKKGEGSFFKVSPWCNIVIVPSVKEQPKKLELVSNEDENALIYMGANRRLYTKKEWTAKYSNCEWCFNPLDSEDRGNRITPLGGCLCGNCSADLPADYTGAKLMSVI